MNLIKIRIDYVNNTVDDMGFSRREIMDSKEIFATRLSVGRADFYSAKSNNISLDEVVKVRYFDYKDGQDKVTYDEVIITNVETNTVYKLVRDYQRYNDEYIELYLANITEELV